MCVGLIDYKYQDRKAQVAKVPEKIDWASILHFRPTLWVIYFVCVFYYVSVFPFISIGRCAAKAHAPVDGRPHARAALAAGESRRRT